jgi:biotin operon repressor
MAFMATKKEKNKLFESFINKIPKTGKPGIELREFLETVVKAIEQGHNQFWMANQLGVTSSAVSYRIKSIRNKGIDIPVLTGFPVSREIVQRLGLSYNSVKKRLKTNGHDWCEKSGRKVGQKTIDINTLLNKLVEASGSGNLTWVAKELGISPSTVGCRLKLLRWKGIHNLPYVIKGRLTHFTKDDAESVLKEIKEIKAFTNSHIA